MSAVPPPVSLVTSSAAVLSPHIRIWSPRRKMSPRLIAPSPSEPLRALSIASSGSKSSSVPSGSGSGSRKPKSIMSISRILRSSSSRIGRSHIAISPVLLSARRYARACSSVRSEATITGTLASPSFSAAFSLVCPTMITPDLSTTIGCLKPNSLIEAATASTAFCGILRGLFS